MKINNYQNKRDILIVDDLPDNLRVLSEILIERNYQVRKAINGKTAIRAAQLSMPDLILLDIKMPEMDGYDVCKELKSNKKTAEIPIIFISALDDTIDKIKAFEVGGVDYVTKPFHVEEVLARIESQLTIQRQKKQLQKEIEQRKYTEEILHQSRAVLSSVLNSSLDGIAALQAIRDNSTGEIIDFRCLIVNPVIAKVFGKNKNDLVGKIGIRKIIDKIDNNLFNSLVKVVETGKSLSTDLYYQCDSLKYWFHFIAVKLGDGCSVTVKNITSRKETELELKKINLDLETFSRSVAHDLRNYINNINFAGNLLAEEINLDGSENEKELIDIINLSCDRTMSILEGITQLSQLKSEPIKPISFNLSPLVSEILNYLQNNEPRINIKFMIQDDVFVNADRKLLNIAIENLIKNAWKYTKKTDETIIEFGEIKSTEKLWQEKIKLIDISPLQFKQKSIYFIKDNGIGFNSVLEKELFTPFKKLHGDSDFDGTGIGLSIVRRIIELHDGVIWAESQLNQGAAFYFILATD
ncbi:response regulator [Geminocystis sp. NIES-3709]|uniref:response regulator n=1 Tax=Geminocystis sp. NIES-3709 TaxID=1617448 RepID=UPI0005FC5F0A|nr:response regulator [Geminocystis sp. NIES-3709]BAQ63686.1 two-component hybrid sensor and regulator [Geminocystis sp. NIES-3709]